MTATINTLHSLSGNTLGEMFHSLNQVIKNQNNEILNNIDYILENYKPKNDLEKVVKIRLIDLSKRYDQVVNIFKSEDTFYISLALQCSWFFQKSNFDAHHLVESVFPLMSFSTRMKVMKKYSKLLKESFFAESLFNLVKERYGISAALTLLPACSEEFIKTILETVTIKVPVNIILPIFEMYPSIVISFLTGLLERCSKKKHSTTYDTCNYDRLFALIAAKEPVTFAMFTEKYESFMPYIKLGKRATRRFIKKSYESVKNNVKEYGRMIKWKNVISNLTHSQVADLQLSAMPKSPHEFMRCCNDYSDFISITADLKDVHKQKILMTCYQRKYGKPITEDLSNLPFSVVKRLPENVCEKWVELKLPAIDDQRLRGDYVMYLPIEKSIPLYKKLIETQSDVTIREHYVSCMFKSVLRKDKYDLIGSVCEYAVKRLRNDKSIIKENIFYAFLNYSNLIKIPPESWVPIEELYNIMFLRNEAKNCLSTIINIISVQIHSRFLNGLPVEAYLDKIQKHCDLYYKYDCCSNTPFQRQCLIWFMENFANKEIKSDDNLGKFVELFSRICEWNSKNSDNFIETPDWARKKIEHIFSVDNDYHKVQILEAIRKDKLVKYKFYDCLFQLYTDPLILLYKLSCEPQTVASRSSILLKNILNTEIIPYRSFFRRAKLYSSFNIPELFCTYCINSIHEKGGDNHLTSKKNAIIVLSIMLPTNKFVEIISEYYPEKSVADDYSDEGREFFEIQGQIASCLKNVNSPSEVLESMHKFAKGDYLKLVVGTLNSIVLRSPESKILLLLNNWLDCPVSLRKHFIRAYFKISPLNKVLEMIVRLFENEKNVSQRHLLFIHSLRFFHAEPSQGTFEVLKTLIERLNSTDELCINELITTNSKVCNEYVSEYLQLLWKVVNVLNKEVADKKRNEILYLVDEDTLVLLKEGFCDILLKHAFEEGDSSRMDLKIFAVRYLLYSGDMLQLDRRLENVMVELDRYLLNWNDFDLKAYNVFRSRNIVFHIITFLVRESLSVKNNTLQPIDIITKFKFALLSKMKEEDLLFEDLLILEMSNVLLSASKFSEKYIELLEFIEPILDRSVSIYNVSIIEYFVIAINKVFSWVPLDEEMVLRVNFVEGLLSKQSKQCHLLALKLIPTSLTNHSRKYIEIIKTCLKISDITTKIHLNKFLTDLTISQNCAELSE